MAAPSTCEQYLRVIVGKECVKLEQLIEQLSEVIANLAPIGPYKGKVIEYKTSREKFQLELKAAIILREQTIGEVLSATQAVGEIPEEGSLVLVPENCPDGNWWKYSNPLLTWGIVHMSNAGRRISFRILNEKTNTGQSNLPFWFISNDIYDLIIGVSELLEAIPGSTIKIPPKIYGRSSSLRKCGALNGSVYMSYAERHSGGDIIAEVVSDKRVGKIFTRFEKECAPDDVDKEYIAGNCSLNYYAADEIRIEGQPGGKPAWRRV